MKRTSAQTKRLVPSFFSAQISQARRFYLELDPPKSQRLTVVCGGSEHCRPDYRVSRSGFQYYSIEFVASGQGLLRLKEKSYRLSPGDIFAYGPQIPHDIQSDPERPLVKYFVDFVGRSAVELLRAPGPEPGHLVQSSSPDHILRLFDDLISAGARPSPFSGRICAAIVEQLLLTIAETAVSPGTIGTVAFDTYQQTRRYIDQHYLELQSLGEIAEKCHLDAAYLCRLFSRFDHQAPYQYLTRLKMLNAAERLREPGVLVKQVASQMGFIDAFSFSRTFRRVLGVSPRRFAQLQASHV